jgi:hypothetical protein
MICVYAGGLITTMSVCAACRTFKISVYLLCYKFVFLYSIIIINLFHILTHSLHALVAGLHAGLDLVEQLLDLSTVVATLQFDAFEGSLVCPLVLLQ